MEKPFRQLLFPIAVMITLFFQTTSAVCPPADFDGNCIVDFYDLQFLAQRWLETGQSSADIASPLGVNMQDFNVLAANWQKSSPSLVINEFMASNHSTIEDPHEPNEFPDWIELYNFADYPVDISGMFLTDNLADKTQWQIPAGQTIDPNSFLFFWADSDDEQGDRHMNFKLDASAESIALIDKDGQTVIDSIAFTNQSTDYSLGRLPDASADWVVFSTSTPGETNANGIQAVADTKFSVDRGFYTAPFNVAISSATENVQIYYTLDGSEPTLQSMVYSEPISITTTTCLRAFAYKPGYASTNIDTQTYIFPNDVVNQPSSFEGYPQIWSGFPADYEMDPEVTTDPNYADLFPQALLAIPTLSIVTDIGHLFNPSSDPNIGGIYLNTLEEGEEWERSISVEFFDSTDPGQFQIDCGLRINGGGNRRPHISPKHSFRLLFKDEYGSTKLKFPLFGPDNADEFDSLVIRGGSNFSWLHFSSYQRDRAQYIRDQWSRDTQLAMGQASAHDRCVHLYLNGIYWGMYNLTERPDGRFMSSYYGGDKDEYDILNSGEVVQGDLNAWNRIFEIAYAGLNDPNNYENLQQYLDIDNIIDYFILNHYTGNLDWNYNWYAGRKRQEGSTYKIFSWDAEMTFMSQNLNNLDDFRALRPTELFQLLRQNKEFKDRFGQKVYEQFFNGGPFYVDPENPIWTPGNPNSNLPASRWMQRAQQIELAVIAESARWGDYRRDVHQYEVSGPFDLYSRDKYWYDEQNRLLSEYFPERTQVLLEQYRQVKLYPMIDAPVFDRQSGQLPAGSLLTIHAEDPGTIYYTLDGTDPRLPNTTQRVTTVLVAEDAEKFICIPDSPDDSSSKPFFEITSIKANIPVTDIKVAMQVISTPDYQQSTITETSNVINFLGEGGNGHFLEDNAFPHGSPSTAPDDFVLVVKGIVNIPEPGPWTFGVNSDDGFVLTTGPYFAYYFGIRQPADTLARFYFAGPGEYQLLMRYFQHTAGANLELFAAQGVFTEFDSEEFRLVGDTQNGGLPLAVGTYFWNQLAFGHSSWNEYATGPSTSGAVGFSQDNSFDEYITYDLTSSMQNKAASCYIRIPFATDGGDIRFFDELKLNMRYDDGFVAYLNGTEIARASAPSQLLFDSTANSERPDEQALTIESFDILQFKDQLNDGDNVLAIQGLNINDTDDDFIISAELIAGLDSPCQPSPTAIEYTSPIAIDVDSVVKARLLGQWQWSTQNKADYTVTP